MINIANIGAEKELDREEMSAIKGGMDIFSNAGKNVNLQSGVSFASPQVNVAPVTQVDASQHTDVDVKNVTKSVDALGSMITGLKV
jgi:S-adenosylmethionine hydrolase